MASLLGIRSDRVIGLAFAISGILAAITALLIVVKTGKLDYRLGVTLTIVGFMATVVGGMGGLIGPAIGGGLIGGATIVLQATLPEGLRNARDAFAFGFVLLLLIVPPRGLIPARSQNQRI